MANKDLHRTFSDFNNKMTEIEDNIHSLDEDFKEIVQLQQKVNKQVIQNERDKERLEELREAHVELGTSIKDDLKKELALLRQEEQVAECSGADLLDENNEIRKKHNTIMENYNKLHDSWKKFHGSQLIYRDEIKSKLTSRFKVVKENATEDEIETLLDPTKDNYAMNMLNDTNMKPKDAKELKIRFLELSKLESFIGKTHHLVAQINGLWIDESDSKELDVERQEEIKDDQKHSWFSTKFLNRYGISTDRRIVFASFGLLFIFLLVIIVASSIPSTETPVTATPPTTVDPLTPPSINPPPPSYP